MDLTMEPSLYVKLQSCSMHEFRNLQMLLVMVFRSVSEEP